VLFDAMVTLQRCDSTEKCDGQSSTEKYDGHSIETRSAARILATDVVESFVAMRGYLREVERCLERVDPHLCNNVGLVARLVDWEESWEVAMRYVQKEKLLAAVCDLVTEIRAAQRLAPALTSMCDDCDVELFLVLPRIIWLRFLSKPGQQTELLRSLLPHRFDETKGNLGVPNNWDAEVEDFLEKFRRAKALLEIAQPQGTAGLQHAGCMEKLAWETLVKRVVNGGGTKQEDDAYDGLAPGLRKEAQAATENLMHDLERWSIELQRHCPEDWNQCSAILIQCLTGGRQRQKDEQFRV